MAHRNRWFTELKNGGSFHGELLNNQRVMEYIILLFAGLFIRSTGRASNLISNLMWLSETNVEKNPSHAYWIMGKIIKNHRNWGQPVFFSSPLRGLSLMELTSREKKSSRLRWLTHQVAGKKPTVFAMANFFRVANDLDNQVIGDQKSQRWAEGWSSGASVSVIIQDIAIGHRYGGCIPYCGGNYHSSIY